MVSLTTIGCSDHVQVAGTIGASHESVANPSATTASCTDNSLNSAQCLTSANRYVTATLGTNYVATATNPTHSTSIAVPISTTGYYTSGIVAVATDTNLLASNILSGATIFGVSGSVTASPGYCTSNAQSGCVTNSSFVAEAPATLSASHANRDAASVPGYIAGVVGGSGGTYVAGQVTSSQLTQSVEVSTYGQTSGGALLPSAGGYNYRDIPDRVKDDDGYQGNTIAYALRPQTSCGSSGTIATRITNCAAANGSRATWNGAVSGNSGQGLWNLVYTTGTNAGACSGTYCKEVWQDTRTGLIWSSLANGGATDNWCRASGNKQNAAVVVNQAYHTAAGTPITGNGTISNISGGSSAVSEIISATFTSNTAFTVTSNSNGCNVANGGITTGALTLTAGSTATFSRANYCSFTITQGSTHFVSGDTISLTSSDASTYSCIPNATSGLQPTHYISYCAEAPGYYPGFVSGASGSGDSYTSGWSSGPVYTYDQAKGGMGRSSTNPVYWRLPTKLDYEQADVDGILFVMPDMGLQTSSRPVPDTSPGAQGPGEWAATSYSAYWNWGAWYFYPYAGAVQNDNENASYNVRCVGR